MAEAARQAVATAESLTVSSRRFDDHAVPPEQVLVFPEGLVGFPGARRFALVEPQRPDSPFRHLVCLDLPDLGFVVCDPSTLSPGYVEHLPRPADPHGELLVLAIVTIPENPGEMTANLMAPLVIDQVARRGWQIVLDTGRYSTRHPILPAAAPDTECSKH